MDRRTSVTVGRRLGEQQHDTYFCIQATRVEMQQKCAGQNQEFPRKQDLTLCAIDNALPTR